MPMFLSLRRSKTISCFLSSIFSVTEVPPLKRFSSLWIAISLFSILTHQNTKSTTGLCIYNTLEERLKTPLKISLIEVDSAYHQEAKAIKFIHFLINCGETSQGLPSRALNQLANVTSLGRPRDVPKNVLTSSGGPHMVHYVTSRDASAAGRPWDVLKTSIYP